MAWNVIVIPTRNEPQNPQKINNYLYYVVSGSCWIPCPNHSVAYAVRAEMIQSAQNLTQRMLKELADWIEEMLNELANAAKEYHNDSIREKIRAKIQEMLRENEGEGEGEGEGGAMAAPGADTAP